MRHGKKFNHLSRKSAHRKAMLSNMASSLILHKRITTTVAKAKALRSYVEPLITRSKTDTTHSRRMVFSYLQNKHAVNELFREVAQTIGKRPGGYTRILKTGNRQGDNAELCLMELVDYNLTYTETDTEPTTKQKSTRRSRRRRKKSSSTQTQQQNLEQQDPEQQPQNQEEQKQEQQQTQEKQEQNDDTKQE